MGHLARPGPFQFTLRGGVEDFRGPGVKSRICPFPQSSGGTSPQPLFWGQRGKRLHPTLVQKKMASLRATLGLPSTATPHSLRHGFASHLLGNGGDLRHIQELFGHVSLSSTQIYTRVNQIHLMKIFDKAHPRAG